MAAATTADPPAQTSLLERYTLYVHLLRLDVIAAWVFVLNCCIVLFGLRPVIRFAGAWAMVTMAFSLPYFQGRSVSVVDDRMPVFEDEDILRTFSRAPLPAQCR